MTSTATAASGAASRHAGREVARLLVHPGARLHARARPHSVRRLVVRVDADDLLPSFTASSVRTAGRLSPQPISLDRPYTVERFHDLARRHGHCSSAGSMLLLAAIALIVGWHSRIAAIVCFRVGPVVRHDVTRRLQRRRHDHQSSSRWSWRCRPAVPRCRWISAGDAESFWSAADRSPWPVRLLQVQLSLIYLVLGAGKLGGDSWLEGSAVSYPWRTDGTLGDSCRRLRVACRNAVLVNCRDVGHPGRSSLRSRSWCGIGGCGSGCLPRAS